MTNLFDFLKNYRDPNDSMSYGDILENKGITNNMTSTELFVYNQLKNSDRQRLINSGRLQ